MGLLEEISEDMRESIEETAAITSDPEMMAAILNPHGSIAWDELRLEFEGE